MPIHKLLRRLLLCWCLILGGWSTLHAQMATVMGTVAQELDKKPIEAATVKLKGTAEFTATTGADGSYSFTQIPFGTYQITVSGEGIEERGMELVVNEENILVPTISAAATNSNPGGNFSSEELIPTTTISESDIQNDKGSSQNVAGLLTSSRDPFVSAASFTFGPMRFRIRGYDPENSMVLINGMMMNELETGRPQWNQWSGLNDVMRNRENAIGLQNTPAAFGAVGGSVDIDMRPSSQRKQLRISYAYTNRSYSQRLMATYSSGMLKGGWAISASASWRFRFGSFRKGSFAGYMPGTDYNAASYFIAIEKKLGERHSLVLTAFGTPQVRGRVQPTFQEMYDLMGDNYYNPNWGWQTSEKTGKATKRNSREAISHQPVIILNHDWNITDKSSLNTAVGFQFGMSGSTALDWINAPDPRPDYYRKLPSYYEGKGDMVQAEAIRQLYQENMAVGEISNVSQVNWDGMYNINRNSPETVANVNGVLGDTVSGNMSRYIVENRRSDSKRFTFNTTYENHLSDKVTLQAGANYQWYSSHNFKVVDDLLGGDFYIDVDKFAQQMNPSDTAFYQNDVTTPNRLLYEGDHFGYDYTNTIHRTALWAQGNFSFSKVDFFVAAEGSFTTYWRTGNVQNGKFPDNSLGESEHKNFYNYSVKGGVTYKINGRNYVFANGMYMTRAPYMRDVFISPRTRNQLVDSIVNEDIYSVEAGYRLRSPRIQLSVTGFFTRFFNQVSYNTFYLDNALRTSDGGTTGGFVNYIMTGINKQHMGVEVGFEIPIIAGLNINGAASVGEYIYISRPKVSVYLDNTSTQLVDGATAYLKNFYVAGSPQMAYTLGIGYNGPKFFFARINANYFMRNFVEINPERRTWAAVNYSENPVYQQESIDPNSQLWKDIIYQEELKGGFTLDIFAGKSFQLKGKNGKNYMLNLNLGVSNVLNNTKMVLGAFEQFRFDYTDKNVGKFPSRYSYAMGANFYLGLTLQI